MDISIHALLAESDGYFARNAAAIRISIHALLAESDKLQRNHSTPHINFYPRSPCGERLSVAAHFGRRKLISIHALLAESDSTSL